VDINWRLLSGAQTHRQPLVTNEEMDALYLSGYINDARTFRPEIGRALAHIAGERRLPHRPKDGDDDPEVTRLLEVLDGLGFTIQIVPKEAFNC